MYDQLYSVKLYPYPTILVNISHVKLSHFVYRVQHTEQYTPEYTQGGGNPNRYPNMGYNPQTKYQGHIQEIKMIQEFNIFRFLAALIPKQIVYWAVYRAWVYTLSTGKHKPTEISMPDVLHEWKSQYTNFLQLIFSIV